MRIYLDTNIFVYDLLSISTISIPHKPAPSFNF